MKTRIRRVGIAAALAVAAFALVAVGARFADGPVGPLPGGRLRAGPLVADPAVDWSFAAQVREIEVQLVEPPRSRTTWVVVHGGALYVPCGFLKWPGLKQWPHQARRDGRAVLRIGGQRFAGRLTRVEDAVLHGELSRLSAAKYGLGEAAPPDPEGVWFFRFEPGA
jgi:hypothetical protein